MDDTLDERLVDFVLSRFDKVHAIRILIALRRAQRLYQEYSKMRMQWNDTLTAYLKKLAKCLEESNDESLRREVNKIKQLITFCESITK